VITKLSHDSTYVAAYKDAPGSSSYHRVKFACFALNIPICYNLKFLEWDKGQILILEKTQENSIESSLQSSLPYIPIHMVCANYCVSYPKVLCIRHEVNI